MSETPSRTPTMPGKNGGRLKRGGKNPNSGRPKELVRAACALAFDRRIPILEQIADGELEASVGERIKAIDTLAKYAGLQQIEHEHKHKHYREAVDEVRKQAGLRLVG